MSVLSKKFFHDEKAAFAHLERLLWPEGPICPHCGTVGRAGKLEGVKGKNGKVRLGLYKCYEAGCRMQFTVRVGTVFESAHIPLHKMLQAVYLMSASKKGCSAHQLHRTLQVTYKTAWFLAHRIREAMREGSFTPMGGPGKPVEADETYIGRLEGMKTLWRGGPHKNMVLTLVERGGSARSFHIDNASVASVVPLLRTNIIRESRLMTDKSQIYKSVGKEYAEHGTVDHGKDEYVRGDIHTNTVEGFYSIFKRGMKGVYQHCKEKHLHRYLAEFDFRYNHRVALGYGDEARAGKAISGIVGKRLYYRQPN